MVLSSAFTSLSHAGVGSYEPFVDEVKLKIAGKQAILAIENASKSGNVSDFDLKVINNEIVFAGVEAKLACGVHSSTQGPNKASDDDGDPRIYYGLVNQNIQSAHYSVDRSVILPSVFHRKGQYKWQGYEKVSKGNGPINFSVPVSKLKAPGKETSLDVVQIFEHKMQQYINNGGKKIDFLRKDQTIDVPAFLSFSAGCHTFNKKTAYATEAVSVSIQYKGDKSLKPQLSVGLGGNQTISQPLHVSAAKIAVIPAVSKGVCPRKITAIAEIDFNQKPDIPQKYKVRFLENGKPVSAWKMYSLENNSSMKIQHKINVVEPVQQTKAVNLNIKPKPSVSVEVKADGNSQKTAFTLYEAACVKENIAGLSLNENKGKPDLTSRQGITIGNKSTAWGGTLSLEQSDFIEQTPRGCLARFKYDVVNIGFENALGFESRIRQSGKQLHLQSNMQIHKNQSKNVSGSFMLPAGTYHLMAHIDDANNVDELNEQNNKFKVMVVVPESCGGISARTIDTGKPLKRAAESAKPQRDSVTTKPRQ